MSISQLLGHMIIFFHNYIAYIIAFLILFFTKIFYLDLFMLLYIYIICFLWYVLNECPLKALEEYLTGEKHNEFDLKKHKVIYILNKKYIVFDTSLDKFSIAFFVMFILFFIKIVYLMYNGKYKFNKK